MEAVTVLITRAEHRGEICLEEFCYQITGGTSGIISSLRTRYKNMMTWRGRHLHGDSDEEDERHKKAVVVLTGLPVTNQLHMGGVF